MDKKNKHLNLEKKPVKTGKIRFTYINPKDLPVWIGLVIFLLTTAIFFWDQLMQNSFFWEDFVEYVFPVQTFAAKEFAKGSLPFWNPYTFVGMPFLADLQVGFFYPLNRIMSLIVLAFNNNLPVLAIEIVIISHFFISQVNLFFLSRYFKISFYGSVIAAISYSFSMLMVCHVIHPMIIYHLAWFPLILLIFIKGINERKIFYSFIAGTIYGFTMLSGHPQTTLYEGLFLAITLIWFLVSGLRNKTVNSIGALKIIISGIITVSIAIGIFSIQYLPSKELADLSQRNEINYEKATEGSLQFKQIYSAIVPKVFGNVEGANEKNPTYYLESKGQVQRHFFWETSFYFGLVGLFLGLFGFFIKYKTKEGSYLVFLALFGFLFALGDGSFIYNLLYNFPFIGNFRNPARLMFFTILAFSLGAGFGFDSLWNSENSKKKFWGLIICGIIPLIIALMISSGSVFDSLGTPANIRGAIQEFGTTSLIVILISILLAVLINRTIIMPSLGGTLLIIVTFLDLFVAGGSFNRHPQNPVKAYEIKPDLKAMLSSKPPKDLFRVNMRKYEPIRFMALERNQGLIDNIMLIEGYNPLVLEKASPPIKSFKTVYDLYNVKYEVKVDLQKSSWAFSERDSTFPRAWFTNKYLIMTPDEMKIKMPADTINYKEVTVLEESPSMNLKSSIRDTINDDITCIDYQNNYFKYKIKVSQSALLNFSEIWYPSWKAFIDGKQVKILRANYCFRTIEVPQGEHTIEMKYTSSAFNTGMYISLITLILALIGMVLSHRYEFQPDILRKKEKEEKETKN